MYYSRYLYVCNSWIFKQLELIAQRYKFKLSDPISTIPKEALEIILYGGKDDFSVNSKTLGVSRNYVINFEGIANFIESQYKNADSTSIKRWAKNYMTKLNAQLVKAHDLKKNPYTLKLTLKTLPNYLTWML